MQQLDHMGMLYTFSFQLYNILFDTNIVASFYWKSLESFIQLITHFLRFVVQDKTATICQTKN